MIFSNIVIAVRNIRENGLYSFMNIIGLAIGMAVFILAMLVYQYQHSYDDFFESSERIYGVYTNYGKANDYGSGVARTGVLSTPPALMPIIERDFPELERVGRLYSYGVNLNIGLETYFEPLRFASEGFFDIFEFDFLYGSIDSFLSDPKSLLMTESAVEEYYAGRDPTGEVISINGLHEIRIVGVIRDLPANSLFSAGRAFDLKFISNALILDQVLGRNMDELWGTVDRRMQMTYLRLPEGYPPTEVKSRLDGLVHDFVPEKVQDQWVSSFELYPLAKMGLLQEESTDTNYTEVIRLVGFIILLITCLNYVNLSTALSEGRSKEIAVRKVLGADRFRLIVQMLSESIVLSYMSLVLSLVFVELLLPIVNSVNTPLFNFDISSSYFSDPTQFLMIALLPLFVGVLAGAYPAFILSSLRPNSIFQGESLTSGKSIARNIMVGAQFVGAVTILITTAIVYQQNQLVIDNGKRFSEDDGLITVNTGRLGKRTHSEEAVQLHQQKLQLFMQRLRKIVGVDRVTNSNEIPSAYGIAREIEVSRQLGSTGSQSLVQSVQVGYDFFETYGIDVIAGRVFSSDRNDLSKGDGNTGSVEVGVVINQKLAIDMGWLEPAEAVGEVIHLYQPSSPSLASISASTDGVASQIRQSFRIVGVTEDFRFVVTGASKPMMFQVSQTGSIVSIRLGGSHVLSSLEAIDRTWKEMYPGLPLNRDFLSDKIKSRYGWLTVIDKALGAATILVMLITCLGLFGLSAFMTAKRRKEIAIRKVLGSSVQRITGMFLIDFSIPILASCLFACPLAYILGMNYLSGHAERIHLSPLLFFSACLFVLFVSWATVIWNAATAARARPLKYLHMN